MYSLKFFICVLLYCYCAADQFPVPYRRVEKRPPVSKFCQKPVPLCNSGLSWDSLPYLEDDDTVEIVSLKDRVWEMNRIIHRYTLWRDSIGFTSSKLGKSFTMEYAELGGPFNGTFPHVTGNNVTWCNQGATCVTPGLKPPVPGKRQEKTVVGQINGTMFNNFVEWMLWDNMTAAFYETWTVLDKTSTKAMHFFHSHDSAKWAMQSYQKLADLGVQFDSKASSKFFYGSINLYSKEPKNLGSAESIFGKAGNPYAPKIKKFFQSFKEGGGFFSVLEDFIKNTEKFIADGFYLYFNGDYWHLPLHTPYIRTSEDKIKLPSPSS